MGGGLLNLITSGELNIILNGNPKKTFLKLLMPNIQFLNYKGFKSSLVLKIRYLYLQIHYLNLQSLILEIY